MRLLHINYTGIRGQKGSQGEKGDRGLPGTCSQQMMERINLTSDFGMERIRNRSDRSDGGEEEGVKDVLTTLFGRCVDAVLTDEEESLAFFGSRSELFSDCPATKSMLIVHFYYFHSFYC